MIIPLDLATQIQEFGVNAPKFTVLTAVVGFLGARVFSIIKCSDILAVAPRVAAAHSALIFAWNYFEKERFPVRCSMCFVVCCAAEQLSPTVSLLVIAIGVVARECIRRGVVATEK